MEKSLEEMTAEEWVEYKLANAMVPKFIVIFDGAEEWGE